MNLEKGTCFLQMSLAKELDEDRNGMEKRRVLAGPGQGWDLFDLFDNIVFLLFLVCFCILIILVFLPTSFYN